MSPYKNQTQLNGLLMIFFSHNRSLVTYLSCLIWFCLPFHASHAHDTASNALYLFLVVLVIACILQLAVIIVLNKSRSRFLQAEATINQRHQSLEQRFEERSQKLVKLNSQLYEEIAKHEITEELLRETQDNIQSIINSMPSILIGVSDRGFITHWNTAAQEATGISYDKALGYDLNEIAPELAINKALITRAIRTKKPQKRESRRHGHGSQAEYSDLTIYPLISLEVEGAVIRIDDVTMRVRLETMMVQNEKMNSLGQLAAGVAHEINNPLSTILQSTQNIQRRTSKDLKKNSTVAAHLNLNLDAIHTYLENREVFTFLADIKDAGERATAIVKNMLEFSRADNHQFELVDIKDLLDRSIDLALHSVRASNGLMSNSQKSPKLTINKHYPDNMPLVPCSAAELQQVILNLFNNAHHAFMNADMADKNVLTINIELGFSEASANIVIRDNGPGMDAWTQKHIFDPFFTTKDVGQGTGLGLSVSYFIITEHHGGMIQVDSKPGQGSEFTISLPLKV